MALSLLSFTTAVNNSAAAAQAACARALDFTVGSPFRALLEANAALLMWVEWLIVQVLGTTRAATSAGADLDTWMADFGLARLPGVASTGVATFSRFTATATAFLPVGTQAKTADGTQAFAVGTDTTNALWNAGLVGYLMPAGTYSVSVPVVAQAAGTGGNIQSGTLTLIASAVAGIDAVTNAAAFTSGAVSEADAALRARFAVYIAGLRDSTLAGINAAISSVQAGLYWTIQENTDTTGAYAPGMFVVFVDDGSGAPPSSLVASVAVAVNAARACGIRSAVLGTSAFTVNVAMTVTTLAGYTHSAVAANVAAALVSLINSREFGPSLSYVSLGTAASAVAGVSTVAAGYTVNGGTSDVAEGFGQTMRAGSVAVS